jgi:hypothetical protein
MPPRKLFICLNVLLHCLTLLYVQPYVVRGTPDENSIAVLMKIQLHLVADGPQKRGMHKCPIEVYFTVLCIQYQYTV